MIGLYEESQFNSGGQANRLAVLIDYIHKVGLSVKVFRHIYQTALWCLLPAYRQAGSRVGTERQGKRQ